MRLYQIFALSLLIIVLLSSCQKPEEAPEFKRIGKVKVNEVIDGQALVNAEAIFYNPNPVNMKLKKINVEVFVQEKKVGTINQDFRLKIPAESDFSVPLDVALDVKEIGSLGDIFSIMMGAKIPIRFSGHIRAKVHGMGFNVPINVKDNVRINM